MLSPPRRRPTAPRFALYASGHTISDLAKALGYSESYVEKVLAGRLKPSEKFKNGMSIFLGGAPTELLFPEDESKQ